MWFGFQQPFEGRSVAWRHWKRLCSRLSKDGLDHGEGDTDLLCRRFQGWLDESSSGDAVFSYHKQRLLDHLFLLDFFHRSVMCGNGKALEACYFLLAPIFFFNEQEELQRWSICAHCEHYVYMAPCIEGNPTDKQNNFIVRPFRPWFGRWRIHRGETGKKNKDVCKKTSNSQLQLYLNLEI